MRGVSPIVSTILMVAIAIAAAVVVYYITMDVITKQGTQLEEQAATNVASIRIEAATLDVNGTDNTFSAGDANDQLKIYYNLLNAGNSTIKDLGSVAVYILNTDGTTLCMIPESSLIVDTTNKTIERNTSNTTGTWSCTIVPGSEYYIKVTAGNTVSNLYKVKAQ